MSEHCRVVYQTADGEVIEHTTPHRYVTRFVCSQCGMTCGIPKETEHEPLLDGIPMIGWCYRCRRYFPGQIELVANV